MIDTKRVADRRNLRFGSPDEMFADVRTLVAADRAGSLQQTGNWTLGQALGHLATWVDLGYTGHPPELKIPWLIRFLSRRMKRKFIRGNGLQPGVKIGKIPGGTLGTEMMSTEEGMKRLSTAWDRLRKGPPSKPNELFGPLTHDEWINLQLRHAELHLGFFREGKS